MGLVARVVRWALSTYFDLTGWTVEGEAPASRKFVVIAAPHTSNWDFVFFVGGAGRLKLNLSFMGKSSLFRWPFGGMMRDLGGVSVDRAASKDMVGAMVAEFAKRDEFMLTIAPEGTRGRAGAWKTGFYHIAMGAKVPMVCGMMDYGRKVVSLGRAIMPTGDYEADMAVLKTIYSNCTPKHPQGATY
jgi:1-acyl-sn-glycerol-3-phosphate acyltransferase